MKTNFENTGLQYKRQGNYSLPKLKIEGRTLSMDEFPTVKELTARWESEANGGKGISANEKKVIEQPYYSSQTTYAPRYYQRNAINRTVL